MCNRFIFFSEDGDEEIFLVNFDQKIVELNEEEEKNDPSLVIDIYLFRNKRVYENELPNSV